MRWYGEYLIRLFKGDGIKNNIKFMFIKVVFSIEVIMF